MSIAVHHNLAGNGAGITMDAALGVPVRHEQYL